MEINLEQFEQEGFLGPFDFKNEEECLSLLDQRFIPLSALVWYKSPHEKSSVIIELASQPLLVGILEKVLGKNILLWGSHFIGQPPGIGHNWHLDVEHGLWSGVTVWMGLKNLNARTTISLITRSHLLDSAPQQLKRDFNVNLTDTAAVLREAQKQDPKCELKTFTLKAGQFILWSGRVWHTTLNESEKKRFSIIMQFCTPDQKTKVPKTYDYPGTLWSEVEPPCVLIKGEDKFRLNKLVARDEIEKEGFLRKKIKSKYYKAKYVVGIVSKKIGLQ